MKQFPLQSKTWNPTRLEQNIGLPVLVNDCTTWVKSTLILSAFSTFLNSIPRNHIDTCSPLKRQIHKSYHLCTETIYLDASIYSQEGIKQNNSVVHCKSRLVSSHLRSPSTSLWSSPFFKTILHAQNLACQSIYLQNRYSTEHLTDKPRWIWTSCNILAKLYLRKVVKLTVYRVLGCQGKIVASHVPYL